MKEWNRNYYQVGLKFEPHIVRIKNDVHLKEFLENQTCAALRLANVIRKAYRLRYGLDLNISTKSLAEEIKGHFRIGEICHFTRNHGGKLNEVDVFHRFLDKMQLHMDVIDCGERECDNNRWVWDTIAKLK